MGNDTPLWRAIADSLRADLAAERYGPGDKLPTEGQLAARFGVHRHTVRHALSGLIAEGLLRSRRGAGIYVRARPTEYPLGQRVRFHENLLAAGRRPEKSVLGIETRAASPDEAAVLGGSAQVCVFRGVSLADGEPIALFESVFPLDRLVGIDAALARDSSVTAALAAVGVADYTRLSTRLAAVAATATQAVQLHLEEGAPLLRSSAVNVDAAQVPVEYGRTWFAGDRVTLTLGAEGLNDPRGDPETPRR